MVDIQNKGYCPTVEEIGEYINNSVFEQFCADIKTKYNCNPKIEFSSCSWKDVYKRQISSCKDCEGQKYL